MKKCKAERPEEKIKSDITGLFLSLYAPATLTFNHIKVTPMSDDLLRITVMTSLQHTSSTLGWIWQLAP